MVLDDPANRRNLIRVRQSRFQVPGWPGMERSIVLVVREHPELPVETLVASIDTEFDIARPADWNVPDGIGSSRVSEFAPRPSVFKAPKSENSASSRCRNGLTIYS
jgi:hypothetical protein